jgi:hypothetical protein
MRIDQDYAFLDNLKATRIRRRWSSQELSDKKLSNVLWAGCSVTLVGTEKAKGRRTAPSTSNTQEVSIYIARKDGLFRYGEGRHALVSSTIRHNGQISPLNHP